VQFVGQFPLSNRLSLFQAKFPTLLHRRLSRILQCSSRMLSAGRSWREFSLLLILFAFISPVSSVCYYPNGDVTPNDVPCSDSTTESVCCSLGYVCLSNGICMKSNNPLAASSSSTYVRGSCTDQTWRSSFCPNFCVNPNAPFQDDIAGGEGMARCPDTTIDMYYGVDFDTSAVNCTSQQNVIKFEGKPTNLTYNKYGPNFVQQEHRLTLQQLE
jgi:hypothetical protein